MRVMRGKTFEAKNGMWEKIEVELDSNDLLPEEKNSPPQVQMQLLEVRADYNLVLFLARHGHMSKEAAQEKLDELKEIKEHLMKLKPPVALKRRG